MCNLRYKQQNSIPEIFHNGSGYDFNLIYSKHFKQNIDKRKVDNIPLAAGKSKMLSIGCLGYRENIDYLKIEDFKSSLSNKLPKQEDFDIFIKDNSHKTGKDLTKQYLQNDVEILDYCMNEYVKLSMKEFGLNPLHYVSLPGYSFDCWLMSSGVTLDTLQDKQ